MSFPRYAIVFTIVAVGAAFATRWLNSTTGSALGSSAQLMVPAMIAALIEGQQFARRVKRGFTSSEIWHFVWIATVIAVGLNLVLAYGGPSISDEFSRLAIAPFASKQFIILLGLYAGGYLICNRVFFGIGSGNQLSQMRSRGEID